MVKKKLFKKNLFIKKKVVYLHDEMLKKIVWQKSQMIFLLYNKQRYFFYFIIWKAFWNY